MWIALGTQARELRDGELVVGSGADADWRIATADLMPRHFTITAYDLNASLRPTTSDNVVAVNGRQLLGVPCLLNDGDIVTAGAGRFVFADDAPRTNSLPPIPVSPSYLADESGNVGRQLLSRSTMLGRDVSTTIQVTDPSVSRFHAEVRREAGGFALHSMGSAGTLLNGRKVLMPMLLSEGDVIEIARRRWRFTKNAPPAASPGPRDVPSGKRWRTRAPETGTVDIISEPAATRSRLKLWAIVGVVLAVALVGFLVAVRS